MQKGGGGWGAHELLLLLDLFVERRLGVVHLVEDAVVLLRRLLLQRLELQRLVAAGLELQPRLAQLHVVDLLGQVAPLVELLDLGLELGLLRLELLQVLLLHPVVRVLRPPRRPQLDQLLVLGQKRLVLQRLLRPVQKLDLRQRGEHLHDVLRQELRVVLELDVVGGHHRVDLLLLARAAVDPPLALLRLAAQVRLDGAPQDHDVLARPLGERDLDRGLGLAVPHVVLRLLAALQQLRAAAQPEAHRADDGRFAAPVRADDQVEARARVDGGVRVGDEVPHLDAHDRALRVRHRGVDHRHDVGAAVSAATDAISLSRAAQGSALACPLAPGPPEIGAPPPPQPRSPVLRAFV